MTVNVLMILAGLVIVVLAGVAGYYQWQLYQLRKRQARDRQEIARRQREQRQFANDSIQLICRALLQRQVGPAEASLRICGLLDILQIPSEQRVEADIMPFTKMADSISHIPILDEWKALPKPEKREYQKLIDKRENEMGDFIRASAERLLGRTF